jgi:hypothetical protein
MHLCLEIKERDQRRRKESKKVRKSTKKQRRQKISKSGKPKGEENKPAIFQFFRTDRFSG